MNQYHINAERMNQYHIYEAIGHGKHSTVYKGRKKKTIEYFAIKSVDKSQKAKVLQEGRVLHSLDHPNVLKFYSWYETSAHLWLVLEYCVGGNLMTLLQQDTKLPEDSIHDLACGLVRALQFLHSKGILYCDLKPSNILLDANGLTKLCDFGLSRKLNDISRTPSSQLPQAKRGTPCYMAPELFQDGGVHSYSSDLWALGCVMYECYAGRPPFVAKEFTQLVKSILADPIPALPGTPSRPFVNLINSLLIKDPAERIPWSELCEHAFWRAKFSLVSLPPQPAFDNLVELSSRPHLSERNSEKPPHNKTPQKARDRDPKGIHRHDENSNTESKGPDTPNRGISSTRKPQHKASGRNIDNKHKDTSNNTREVNLLRLSRIAKSNLRRENEKQNYRRPLPNSSENDAEVKIENNDMELDFSENTEDETNDEADDSEGMKCTTESTVSPSNEQQEKVEGTDDANSGLSPMVKTPFSDDSRNLDLEPSSEHSYNSATLPSDDPQQKTPRIKDGTSSDADTPKSSTSLSQVLWHPSDLSVRPVMPSRKLDKVSGTTLPLPFDPLLASDFVKMSKEQSDLTNRIISIITGNTSTGEKQNVIKYLEMLSSNADAANILTNGPIMLVLVKMLRQSKASLLHAQLASLIGLLIRRSTFIGDELSNSGILGALTDGLRDRQDKVRRFSMAALGELLFYISTQDEHARDNSALESPSKDNRVSSAWQVTSSIISLVSSVLRNGEDDMTQLYALRTIENISSQGGHWSARFTSQAVLINLCHIFRAPGKQEMMKLTAGSCLVRLVRFSPSCIQRVLDKLPLKDISSILVKGSQREQQICLNLLNMALSESHMPANIGRYLPSLLEDKNLVPHLISLIEQGGEVLKGKALLFVALLCKNGRRWLAQFFCNAKLLSAVDRLVKDKDSYVKQCLDSFAYVVASSVPSLLETTVTDIQQLMSSRRRGQIMGASSRNSSKTNFHFFPVVLHLLGCSLLKQKVASHQVIQQLANLMRLMESPFQGRDDFQITLLRILESIAEETSVIKESCNIFTSEVLPSLCVLYKGNSKDGDARFLCLKVFFDLMVTLLNEVSGDEQKMMELKSISNSHFLPMYPSLVEDEDPIPVYAQKLLVMFIEYSHIKIPDILHMKIISQCFEFLLVDFSSMNVNNVMLCLALASAPELDTEVLSQLKVVRKLGSLLEFVRAREMENFIEPTLCLCKAFLLRSAGTRKGSSSNTKESAPLLYDNSSHAAIDRDECSSTVIRDIADFGENVGVLLDLSNSSADNISDVASECLVLLLKAAPREATTGFLTNLARVTVILESWSPTISNLVPLRILYALAHSCRQYLSHSMILAIHFPDISKLERVLSQLKSCTLQTVADAAFCASSELQRLPHRY
ncbi:unnamed protein product [Cuscuta epithymum]|uniref:Protein kinase domain-containing protein n=1 Tax=Cuscuta epithymum TaxID=186058 RepID=A0AAV0CI46_9ASTE|nr:unnamed protein product [Cuscuta epithymum]